LPEESVNYRPAVLAAHHGSGVMKKTKRGRKSAMSSKARKRYEKGQDRAEAIMDRTQRKVEKSKDQARNIIVRSKGWEEINKKTPIKNKTKLDEDEESETNQINANWETDEEMDGDADSGPKNNIVVPTQVPLPAEDEDEIL
jgi:hypothetical protein